MGQRPLYCLLEIPLSGWLGTLTQSWHHSSSPVNHSVWNLLKIFYQTCHLMRHSPEAMRNETSSVFYITNTCFYFECQRDRRTATLSKYLFLLSVLHKECLTFVVWPRKSRLRSASPECGGLGPEPRSTLPLQKIWANSVNFDYGVQSFLVEGFQKMPHRAWTDGPAFHSDLWVFGKSHGINTSWCKPIVKHRALFPSW